jgi:hypothetical protein
MSEAGDIILLHMAIPGFKNDMAILNNMLSDQMIRAI